MISQVPTHSSKINSSRIGSGLRQGHSSVVLPKPCISMGSLCKVTESKNLHMGQSML